MHKLCVGCGTQGAAADCSANHAGPARSQKNLEGPLRGAHPPTHGATAQLAAFSSSYKRSEKNRSQEFQGLVCRNAPPKVLTVWGLVAISSLCETLEHEYCCSMLTCVYYLVFSHIVVKSRPRGKIIHETKGLSSRCLLLITPQSNPL